MRYDPRRRIKFPDKEDAKLWRVIEEDDFILTKIPRVAPKGISKQENWYATASIEYAPGKITIVDFKEFRKLGQSTQQGINSTSIISINRKRKAWRENGIPVLLVGRADSSMYLSFQVRKWVEKLQRELEEENGRKI